MNTSELTEGLPLPERLADYHSTSESCRCPDRKYRKRVCKHQKIMVYVERYLKARSRYA